MGNPFQGHELYMVNKEGVVKDEVVDLMRRNAFHGDGAIVVDGYMGRVIASGWFVNDISQGGLSGGARSRSAKAVAMQAGNCFVIKVSEDSQGMMQLHLGTETTKLLGKVFDSMPKIAFSAASSNQALDFQVQK